MRPPVIERILRHLKLWDRPERPPRLREPFIMTSIPLPVKTPSAGSSRANEDAGQFMDRCRNWRAPQRGKYVLRCNPREQQRHRPTAEAAAGARFSHFPTFVTFVPLQLRFSFADLSSRRRISVLALL